jgi:hypothetical protein
MKKDRLAVAAVVGAILGIWLGYGVHQLGLPGHPEGGPAVLSWWVKSLPREVLVFVVMGATFVAGIAYLFDRRD